jgi:hypothetical protein
MKALFFSTALLVGLSPIGASAQAFPEYGSMLGTWNCTSALGSSITYTFSMTDDGGWLALHSAWNNPKGTGAAGFFQNYLRRFSNGSWVALSYGSNGWTFQGRSSGWTGGALTLTGVQQTGRGDITSRESFATVGGKLQHRWQLLSAGKWVTTSDTTCVRS